MKYRADLSAKFVRECFSYDKRTGVLAWKIRPLSHFKTEKAWKIWNGLYSKTIVDCHNPDGYLVVGIKNKIYIAHRIMWLIVTGKWPENQTYHIDLNKANNRWNNLRSATNGQNGCNKRLPKNNTSGMKGVFWHKQRQKWMASIGHQGKQINLGLFKDKLLADAAYRAAAQKLHGDFYRSEG